MSNGKMSNGKMSNGKMSNGNVKWEMSNGNVKWDKCQMGFSPYYSIYQKEKTHFLRNNNIIS